MPDIVLPSDHSAALLAGLHQGGHVNYPRHTETAASPGAQLRELSIADGTVESSPICRTRQTAELVFGRLAKVNPDLFYHVSQLPAEVLAADTKLTARLGQRPPVGGNLVLVGHAPTMRDVSGVELPEGQGAIVKSTGGRYVPYRRTPQRQWNCSYWRPLTRSLRSCCPRPRRTAGRRRSWARFYS